MSPVVAQGPHKLFWHQACTKAEQSGPEASYLRCSGAEGGDELQQPLCKAVLGQSVCTVGFKTIPAALLTRAAC